TARAARAATRAEVSSAGGSTVAAGLAAEASVMTGSGPVVTALVSAVAGLACLPGLGAVEVAGEGAVSAWGAGFACLVVFGFLGLAGVSGFFCRDLPFSRVVGGTLGCSPRSTWGTRTASPVPSWIVPSPALDSRAAASSAAALASSLSLIFHGYP